MATIPQQLSAISALIATANADTSIHFGSGDDAIISAIVNMEHNELMHLPNSDAVLATVNVVQPRSQRVAAALGRVVPMLSARGYRIG